MSSEMYFRLSKQIQQSAFKGFSFCTSRPFFSKRTIVLNMNELSIMLSLMLCVTTGGEIRRGILNIQQYFLPETTLHFKEVNILQTEY